MWLLAEVSPLAGYQTEGCNFLPAGGQRPPSDAFYVVLSKASKGERTCLLGRHVKIL